MKYFFVSSLNISNFTFQALDLVMVLSVRLKGLFAGFVFYQF